MHQRNIYNNPIDFFQLAKDCPSFSKYLNGASPSIDFHDPGAVRALTTALLKKDFDLDVKLPDDRLCPRRFRSQIDLLDSTGKNAASDDYDLEKEVIGLDIGVGSSCIYPLLGCKERPKWKFIGTEIDRKNLKFSQDNVSRNNLDDRIRIIESQSAATPLIDLGRFGIETLDFTMCNPPFYDSLTDLIESSKLKKLPPHSACTGTPTEMVYSPGGEVSFISRMITESLTLRTNVQWYTSMVGKLSSLHIIVNKLKQVGCKNWAVGRFVQGKGNTRRWVIGWSWGDRRPSKVAAIPTPLSANLKGFTPFPTEFYIRLSHDKVPISVTGSPVNAHPVQRMALLLGKALEFLYKVEPKVLTDSWFGSAEDDSIKLIVIGQFFENLWSRAARRKREKKNWEEDATPKIGLAEGIRLGVRIEVALERKEDVNSYQNQQRTITDNPMDEDDNLFHDKDEVEDEGEEETLHSSNPCIATQERKENPEGTINVLVRWTSGTDQTTYESFCGMVRRKLIVETPDLAILE